MGSQVTGEVGRAGEDLLAEFTRVPILGRLRSRVEAYRLGHPVREGPLEEGQEGRRREGIHRCQGRHQG